MAFQILDDFVHTGLLLSVGQNINGFNAASRNCIQLIDTRVIGDFFDEIRWSMPNNFWKKQNVATNAAKTSADRTELGEVNERGVVVRLFGESRNLVSDLVRSAAPSTATTPEQYSQLLGERLGLLKLRQQLNDAILCARAATNQGSSTLTVAAGTNSGKINTASLIEAVALLGDANLSESGVLIMHSDKYWGLVGEQVTQKIPDVAGLNLFQGSPATLGIPTLVTNAPGLKGTRGSGPTDVPEYYTLGLFPGAVRVRNAMEREVVIPDVDTSAQSAILKLHLEGAHSVQVRGYAWDVTNGGISPDDAKLGTSTNWDAYTTDIQQRAGFCLVSL